MKMDFYKLFGYLSYLNYILWLLELNIAIFVVNLPLILIIWIMGIEAELLPIYIIVGITIGPSLLSAFEALPYIEDGIIKHYFSSWKRCWKRAVKIWLPIWFLFLIMLEDIWILQFYAVMPQLKWGIIIALIAMLNFMPTFLMVIATWKQKARDAAILTLKLMLVKPIQCNLNFVILMGTIVLLAQKPIYLFLYGASLGIFLMHKNFAPVIHFVDERPENKKAK